MLRLRYHAASPFCRKALAVLRARYDAFELDEVPVTRDPRAAIGILPVLQTPRGALVDTPEILLRLEAERRVLVPLEEFAEITTLDRMLDLYLLEAAVTLACHPGTPAADAARRTGSRALLLAEDRLARRPFLMGEGITLPDLTLLIGATDVQRLGLELPGRVQAHAERVQASLPGVQDVVLEADALWHMLASLDSLTRQAA